VACVVLPVLAGTTLTFTTSDPAATITDNTGTFTACQNITVAGMPTQITDVTVSVSSNHSWVGDLTLRLTSPSASVLTLINRPGRLGTGAGNDDNLVTGTPITYSDTAASGVSAEDQGDGCAGTIGVTAGCPDNYTPAPDATDTPIAGVGTNFAQYDGADPNGVWQLCIADSAAGDTGTLTSWSITVTSTPVELQSFSIE
jgi:subtilisin-like proprotein convertase family protein